jgi:hypothetical protein
MPYDKLDGRKIKVLPLAERESFIDIEIAAQDPLADPPAIDDRLAGQVANLAEKMRAAREGGKSIMLAYGAHLIKNGGATLVNWLVENGWATHVATQGAGIIHDWEFSFQRRSSESVRDNAPIGRFGTWDETGRAVNLTALVAAAEGIGLGEGIGRTIEEDGWTLPDPNALAGEISADPGGELTAAKADLLWAMDTFGLGAGRLEVPHPWKRFSAPACCYRCKVPFTVHPGIGYDIYTNHPMFHGGAIGRATATDQRIFARSVENLSGGVYLSVGSAIMSPQVFEKAFSAANNLREQAGKPFIEGHTIAINDIQEGGDWDWSQGEPPKDHPAYYLRFCKSFYRMGGTVDYLCEDNRTVLKNLIAQLR